jgi:gamma-glutamylcyclotransferase
MFYFAYGSNMSFLRLKQRIPSAEFSGCYALHQHDLRFHKVSKDGSGKCDAFYTADHADIVYGALFQISPKCKIALDKFEGAGAGYIEKSVSLINDNGESVEALTYVATRIDGNLKPFSWYLGHVITGATDAGLPNSYFLQKIKAIETIEDNDLNRDRDERSIYLREHT